MKRVQSGSLVASQNPTAQAAVSRLHHGLTGVTAKPRVARLESRFVKSGIERADSIAFDPHKWLYTPHSGGCVLVRDLEDLPRSFSIHEHASYVFEDKERTGTGLDAERDEPPVLARVLGPEGVGLSAGPRPQGIRDADRPRRRASIAGSSVERRPRGPVHPAGVHSELPDRGRGDGSYWTWPPSSVQARRRDAAGPPPVLTPGHWRATRAR
jgi:hypothetical protein